MSRLDHREQRPADLLIRGAHVLDPRERIDAPHDVLVRDGEIAEIAPPNSLDAPDGAETLDGAKIWIVGDVLHSRVARSDILAFTKLGAEVTVCGPPTLLPRGVEALGCKVEHRLDRLSEADVVYALRMQKERMTDSFVPSIREYAAQYQIDGRRLGARQVLMHPGPVNRGVELAAEVIDSPQAVIGQQVAAGVVTRMAVLYELLAGRTAPDRSDLPVGAPA